MQKPVPQASSSSSRLVWIVAASLAVLVASLVLSGASPTQLYTQFLGTYGARNIPTQNNPDRARGLIVTSGIELLTFGTPNGHKASIMLEELMEAYNKSFVWQSVPIGENVQKEQWYTALNPNGKIPTIVDHDRGDFAVMEGSAILAYLTRRYDPEHKFSFKYDSDDFSIAEQWVAWQHGGLGPMQGQANHFYRLAKERIPYPTQRYVGEAERLYGILETRLANRDYLVGPGRGKYSIADIASFSWVNVAFFAGVDVKKFPNVSRWAKSIEARPAVKKGLAIPSKSKIVNSKYEERLGSEDGFEEGEDKLRELMEKAKEQYSYTYSSP